MRPRTSIPVRAPLAKAPALIPQAVVDDMLTHFNAQQWAQLELKARPLVMRYPGNPFALRAWGKSLLKLGRPQDAIEPLLRVVKLTPSDGDAHGDLGLAYYGVGKLDKAEAHYRQALVTNPHSGETLSNLGVVLNATGQIDSAIACYRASIQCNPHVAVTHNNLGTSLRNWGRQTEALRSYEQALQLNPQYVDAFINLGATLLDLQRVNEAAAAAEQALALSPNSVVGLTLMGQALGLLIGQEPMAIAYLERALAIEPRNPDLLVALGNVLLKTGPVARCQEMFRQASALRPFISWPAANRAPRFSLLVLDTPGAGSTPISYLMGHADYDIHFYCVLPDTTDKDIKLLSRKGQAVFNIIADADNGADVLPAAERLVLQMGLPTLNPPSLIMKTDRASIASSLAGLPLCHVPQTVRIQGDALADAARNRSLRAFALPVLVRLAGNHGGDAFEKLSDWDAVEAFALNKPHEQHYVTDFVDYQSPDGFFRKYRVIAIDGEIYPYHLAIHDDWMVHHFRTDMAEQAWKREEERAFLEHPERVFNGEQWAALQAIARSTKLDYCGIDCGIEQQGQIVVFEVNATMLVHDEKSETFMYKNAHVSAIKKAFAAMVEKRVLGHR